VHEFEECAVGDLEDALRRLGEWQAQHSASLSCSIVRCGRDLILSVAVPDSACDLWLSGFAFWQRIASPAETSAGWPGRIALGPRAVRPAPSNLPSYPPIPGLSDPSPEAAVLDLDADLVNELRALATAHFTVLDAVLVAALHLLLHRYTGDRATTIA